MNIELFPCSGALAEGLRRAGIKINMAFDRDADACDSYARNHGHRPVQIDVNDLCVMVAAGWLPTGHRTINGSHWPVAAGIDLLIADPPCQPWSRAGKRAGLDDERDCMVVTVELIRMLRPRAYLIGNVPGLEDSTSWPALQKTLAPLAKDGYCIRDFATIDAADVGVPQHRVRPFWFGHLAGPCIRWPSPTHEAPSGQHMLVGEKLLPWVTCRDALSHLAIPELGRPVRMRLREKGEDGRKNGGDESRLSKSDNPAKVVTTKDQHKGGQILLANDSHPTAQMGAPAPAPTVRAKANAGAQGANVLAVTELQRKADSRRGQNANANAPAPTVTSNDMGEGVTMVVSPPRDRHPLSEPESPAMTLHAEGGREGRRESVLAWPWDRPSTTVTEYDRLPSPGHHSVVKGQSTVHGANAVILSERAAAILQGFPDGECVGHVDTETEVLVQDGIRPGERCPTCDETRRWYFAGSTKSSRWKQLGMAMPIKVGEVVGRAIVEQMETTEERDHEQTTEPTTQAR